jgi:NAD(P)-dependent dehydrogenase (short-subunit alcohol dehydrogenase family)
MDLINFENSIHFKFWLMEENLSGKVVLITGSTDGLGKLIAIHLAKHDAVVLIHGRNKEKGKKLVDEIYNQTRNNNLKYYNGDFASLQEVKSLGDEILSDNKQINILINNAAIASIKNKKREISKDGYELHFAVNYLAQVLLTEKLLPGLEDGVSEIINIASVGQEAINFSDVMLLTGYDGFLAYRQSKSALIMYNYDLSDRLKKKNINVNAVHPASLMNTKMVLEGWGYSMTTVEQGAEAVESLLHAKTTGKYYDGINISKSIPQTYDVKARETLRNMTWQLLEKYLV